jgi:hypothetical protein
VWCDVLLQWFAVCVSVQACVSSFACRDRVSLHVFLLECRYIFTSMPALWQHCTHRNSLKRVLRFLSSWAAAGSDIEDGTKQSSWEAMKPTNMLASSQQAHVTTIRAHGYPHPIGEPIAGSST